MVTFITYPLIYFLRLYSKENYLDLVIYLVIDFLGRNIFKFRLTDSVWDVIGIFFQFKLFIIIFLLYFIFPNLLTMIFFSFINGIFASVVYTYNKIKAV